MPRLARERQGGEHSAGRHVHGDDPARGGRSRRAPSHGGLPRVQDPEVGDGASGAVRLRQPGDELGPGAHRVAALDRSGGVVHQGQAAAPPGPLPLRVAVRDVVGDGTVAPAVAGEARPPRPHAQGRRPRGPAGAGAIHVGEGVRPRARGGEHQQAAGPPPRPPDRAPPAPAPGRPGGAARLPARWQRRAG